MFGGILVVLFVVGSLEASAFQVTILWHMYNLSQMGFGCFDVLIIAIQIDEGMYFIEECV